MNDSAAIEINLKPLFQKLGHQLEEIRVRALKNILSKLEHDLLCDADLVHERHFHIRLLEWFNFSSCPLQEQVLALILRFSKHPSAAQIYVQIGAVEFLSQLRPNLDTSLHRLIDAILDNFFHIPTAGHEQHNPQCLYQHQALNSASSVVDDAVSSQYPMASVMASDTMASASEVQQVSMGKLPSPDIQDVGYFGHRKEETQTQAYTRQPVPTAISSCFKFCTFPWVALNSTDRHVLSSTDSSLKSKDMALVVSACEFLSDVVFQDFPAEVFLQRPVIVKSLLSLLAVAMPEKQEVTQHAVQTLRDLTAALEARIYFYQDPSLYTPKQDVSRPPSTVSSSTTISHTDSRHSAIGNSYMRHRGDGQDGEASPDNSRQQTPTRDHIDEMIEHTDLEDIQSLQFLQWTTPQYCMAVLEKLLPCLKGPDERFLIHGAELVQQVAALLQESVARHSLWTDGSLPARELRENFYDVLEMVGDVMYLHHHSNLSSATPAAEMSLHRVAFMGLAMFLVRLIEILVPADRVREALPESSLPVLELICQDEALSYSYPDVRMFTLDLLEILNPEGHNLFHHTRNMVHSFSSTCAFLCDFQDMSDDSVLELLNSAEDGIRSLEYHQNMQHVTNCVQLASFICKKSSPNPMAVQRSTQLLLTLLAHPLASVKRHAYNSVLEIVKDSLGVEHVTEPTSTVSQAITFLFDRHLLYQITCFGCTDAQPQVRQLAEEVLLYLVQSQLLLPAARWQQLLDAFSGVLPVLQCLGDVDSKLCKGVLGLITTDPLIDVGNLPVLEKFRANLRLMYSHTSRMRMEGLGKLAWFLANETDSMRKLPLFSELDIANLTNLLIIDTPRSLLDADLDNSVFSSESMQKVFEIFVSKNVEATVRHSAGEQLAIILEDPNLHDVFHKLGGVEKLLSLIRIGITKPEEKSVNAYSTVLPCLVKILRSLAQHDSSLRHQWAHTPEIYYMILRCGLLHYRDPNARKDAAEMLALILFDEVTQVQTWEEEGSDPLPTFSLPSIITDRYKLPFVCRTHHLRSPHTVLLAPQPDPLLQGGLAEMLRLAWNVAWSDGIDAALKDASNVSAGPLLFNKALKMTAVDSVVLRTSHLPSALQQCVHNIENATEHGSVAKNVLRLSTYIVISPEASIRDIIQQLQWHDTVTRFVSVIPSSSADEALLTAILQLLIEMMRYASSVPEGLREWVAGLLHNPRGALLGLLARDDLATEDLPESTLRIRRQLNRHLLKFVHTYVGKCPYSLADRNVFHNVYNDLVQNLLTHISRRDTTHFYNLASLESTLLCLMQVTARPGWSGGGAESASLSVSLQALQNLSEVISAFHVGRGGMSMSYMGRGVTRCATICLRHLAHEMATQLQNKDWPRNWLFSREATPESDSESGLHWLIPLWSYRDTEVRSAAVGIAAALTSTEEGRLTMDSQCRHIAGGIWGTGFGLLLDHSECSLVRQQACLLLINLTSQSLPTGSVQTSANVWQGPIVKNEETQVSLVGLAALLALLHHSQFYQEMMVLLGNYYPQPAIHPISVAGGSQPSSGLDSQATFTTAGSMTSMGTSHLTNTSANQLGPHLSPTDPHSASLRSSQEPSSQGDSSRSLLASPSVLDSNLNTTQNTDTHTASMSAGTNTPASLIAESNTTTVSGTSTAGSQDYHSVVAPCLVSAVCNLLGNLVALAPTDTLRSVQAEHMHTTLLNLLDVGLIEAYRAELCNTAYKKQFLVTFQDLLALHGNVLQIITHFCREDATIRNDVLQNTVALRQIVRLLGVSYQGDANTESLCCDVWHAVFSTLSALLQLSGQEALQQIMPIIVKQWPLVSGRVVSMLRVQTASDSGVWVSAQTFLALALCEEGKLLKAQGGHRQRDTYYMLDRLDSETDTDQQGVLSVSSGGLLGQELLKAYDAVCLRPMDQHYLSKVTVMNALKSLLLISNTAKMSALEAGLVETICENVQRLQLKLTMDALEVAKSVAGKKKENPLTSEMIMTFDLLKNFMYAHTDVKIAALDCGLGGLVHSLWAWCQMEPALMECVLALLSTFTAQCPQACSSLAYTSPSQTLDRSVLKSQLSNNSLVHAVIKLLQRESKATHGTQLLKAGFALLSNLTLSQECRGILWKSNFLHDFSSFSPKKSKKVKRVKVLEALWMDLLVNLSFSTEGQNMILKVEDAVSLLLEFGSDGTDHNRMCATLVLRNLCFHAANKPKLLANEKLVPFLLQTVEESTGESKKIGCSGILALLYNNQKAKGILKNTQIQRKLQDSYNQVINMADDNQHPWLQSCAKDLHSILVLLRS